MMLDMKRTFDEVVVAHSTPEKADQILANPFYQAVSSSFAGTQEYMAMEKLGQLHQEVRANGDDGPRWDLIVVDTPPSRSALDFLDAPKRLGSFLDGRFIRLISAPAKAGRPGRAAGLQRRHRPGHRRPCPGSSAARCSATSRPSSARSTRCSAGSASARTRRMRCWPSARRPSSSSPRPSGTPFVRPPTSSRGSRPSGCRLTGLVLNRVQQVQAPGLGAARARAAAEERADDGDHLTAGLLALHADIAGAADRQRKLARRFSVGHPSTPVVEVPALAEDVHDVDGLRQVGEALAAG